MKRFPLLIAALAVPAVIGVAAVAGTAYGQNAPGNQTFFGGPCPGYGQGMGPGWGMGRGAAMGPGMGAGPGRAGGFAGTGAGPRAAYWADANHDGTLTADEVKAFVDARHDRRGFEGLEVGAVTEKDDATLAVEIVTADGNLVRTMEFPRKVDASVANRPGRGGFGPGMRSGRGGGWDKGFGPARQSRFDGRGYGMGMRAGLVADGELSVDEVKSLVERRLAMWNNPNLKVGEVKAQSDTVVSADIVTKDGSLVEHLQFDRKTGFPVRDR